MAPVKTSWATSSFAVSPLNASPFMCARLATSSATASHTRRNPTRYASITDDSGTPSRARSTPNSVAALESNSPWVAMAPKIGRMFAAQACATKSNGTGLPGR
jgi:hypothetical protein